jgi:hypothetical protein
MSDLLKLITGAADKLADNVLTKPIFGMDDPDKESKYLLAKHNEFKETRPSNYQDATGGMQSVMSQAGISNPVAGQLRGGTQVFDAMPSLSSLAPPGAAFPLAQSQEQPEQYQAIDAAEADINDYERQRLEKQAQQNAVLTDMTRPESQKPTTLAE